MTPTTLNSRCFSRAWQALIALLLFVASNAQAAPVAEDVVRRVAQNYIANHIANFGNWNGGLMAEIESVELVRYENTAVAYSVAVRPSGYLLVAYDDDFSPVLLYSDRGTFVPSRVADFGSAESWIIPETHAVKARIASRRSELKSMLQESAVEQTKLDSKSWQAWVHFDKTVAEFSTLAVERKKAGNVGAFATIGPLLTTTWNQGEEQAPFTYKALTPTDPGFDLNYGCLRNQTGCVATATAQVMRYWSWPEVGTGSHSYAWYPQSGASPNGGVPLTASFAHAYDWSSMPDNLTASATVGQINAIAGLMRDIGVAVDMEYGCKGYGGSGSSTEFAATYALPTYFKYKPTVRTIARSALSSSEFFATIKTELDAVPPRPMLFRMSNTAKGGHAVVLDGYQTGTTDMAHVNMGWGGQNTAYYDITNNWTAGFEWVATTQVAYTGIEPDRCQKILSQTSRTVLATS